MKKYEKPLIEIIMLNLTGDVVTGSVIDETTGDLINPGDGWDPSTW